MLLGFFHYTIRIASVAFLWCACVSFQGEDKSVAGFFYLLAWLRLAGILMASFIATQHRCAHGYRQDVFVGVCNAGTLS